MRDSGQFRRWDLAVPEHLVEQMGAIDGLFAYKRGEQFGRARSAGVARLLHEGDKQAQALVDDDRPFDAGLASGPLHAVRLSRPRVRLGRRLACII